MAAKKSARNPVPAIVSALQTEIESSTRDLTDNEYIEALEEIESFCKSCVEAKREELSK